MQQKMAEIDNINHLFLLKLLQQLRDNQTTFLILYSKRKSAKNIHRKANWPNLVQVAVQ